MIPVRLATVAALIALAGCATPQARLERGLINAGLSKTQSACMADRMVDKLSLLQLRRLSSLSNFEDEKLSDMTLSRFMRNIRALKDPEILAITTRAAIGCAISG
jgi:hypothetical protein